ncbi:MAG: ATP-binding protein [Ignavibacteriales bacterium]|nr:ATP-binding protein [Ignavibacteriales bacterium]
MKKTKIVIFLFLLFYSLSTLIVGQSFNFINYSDENGLASNLTKACVQDSNGFIWIATDAGVVRFDGKNFVSININLPSLYIKDISITPLKEILISTDLGVGYITQHENKFLYSPLLKGYTLKTDTSLFYPKSIYFDKNKNLWISDNNGVVFYKDGKLKKYVFAHEYTTDSYSRSFSFAEDNAGNLIVSSWQGYLFLFNKEQDKFIKLDYEPSQKQFYINCISFQKDNSLLAGTSFGILKLTFENNFKKVTSRLVLPLAPVSSFKVNNNGDYYIGTWTSGMYLWKTKTNQLVNLDELGFQTVNNLFLDKENSVWVCSDAGLGLILKTTFAKSEYEEDIQKTSNSYITVLTASDNGEIFFSDQEYIYKVIEKDKKFEYKRIHNSKGKRILSFCLYGNELWISYRNGELAHIKDQKEKLFSQQQLGGRLFSLASDRDGNFWGIDEVTKNIIRIDNNNNIKKYDVINFVGKSQILETTKDGKIYFISCDEQFHFLRYDKPHDKFLVVDISQNKKLGESTIISDFYVANENIIWIASNKGLFKIENRKVIDLNTSVYSDIPLSKAIFVDKNKIWIGTEKGLLININGQITSFNQKDGLPNSVIAPRGIAFDKDNRIWVATSSGLAYWQKESFQITKTPMPTLLNISINNQPVTITQNDLEFISNSNLTANYVSLSFPDRIHYQIRLVGRQENWFKPSTQTQIDYLKLPEGNYTLQIKAKQSGYLWSDITEFHFRVIPPWYKTWWMYTVYGILLILLVVVVILSVQKKKFHYLLAQKEELEKLVSEKTKALVDEKEVVEKLLRETQKAKKELERSNSDLRSANELKSDLLSIAAHDLKNPLGTIMSFSQMILEEENLSPDVVKMVTLIHESSLTMLTLITEILESVIVESTKLKLDLEQIDLNELAEKVTNENIPSAKLKGQEIIFSSYDVYDVLADSNWMRQAIDNLISNAVKYSPRNKRIWISLVGDDEKVQIRVRDEGPGLSDKDKLNLFGKFQRLSAKPTGGESSTGLGLSIVKEIVNLHNGKIWAEGEPGKGSTFIIELAAKKMDSLVY